MRCLNLAIIICLFAFLGTACGESQSAALTSGRSSGNPSATPRSDITPADLNKVKWITGDWRGMDGDKPFFERYRVEDAALVVDSFADETFFKPTDTTRYELRGGQLTNGVYAASEITEDSITFIPVGNARNSFTFKKMTDAVWTATLSWPERPGKPAEQKVYRMERVEQHTKYKRPRRYSGEAV